MIYQQGTNIPTSASTEALVFFGLPSNWSPGTVQNARGLGNLPRILATDPGHPAWGSSHTAATGRKYAVLQGFIGPGFCSILDSHKGTGFANNKGMTQDYSKRKDNRK